MLELLELTDAAAVPGDRTLQLGQASFSPRGGTCGGIEWGGSTFDATSPVQVDPTTSFSADWMLTKRKKRLVSASIIQSVESGNNEI